MLYIAVQKSFNFIGIRILCLNMAEELQKLHLYYDDINKIRVLETNVLKQTEDLRDTCKDYETS